MTSQCPFYTGNPVAVADFIDRRRPLRRIVARLRSGESTAIIGEPRTGKTSLLLHLAAPETQTVLYGQDAERLLFSFVDVEALGGQFTQVQFWEQALAPVKAHLVDPSPDSDMAKQYRVCHDNEFGTYMLEMLFWELRKAGRQLVLLLDEFDQLLHRPILNSAEFFGGMRMLDQHSHGALSQVIASRLSLTRLNAETQELNPTGSPYFNIFNELVLGGFPKRDVDDLLKRAGDRFSPGDRRAIGRLAGRQPFFLQAAAAALWDAYDEGLAHEERIRTMGQCLYREHRSHFNDTWRVWTPETRQAFTVVALDDAQNLLPERKFRLNDLLDDLPNWTPELADLEHAGLLAKQPVAQSGYRITQEIMLWWLADKLVRALRSESAFSRWLQTAELEGRWTKGQKQQVGNAVRSLGSGAGGLIEKFVMAFGAGTAMGPG